MEEQKTDEQKIEEATPKLDGNHGMIFNIQYFCVHDGPGIRTTVFMKGCPLNCLWCHNPEGIGTKTHLSFSAAKCINCGACVKACPEVHKMVDGKHVIDRNACTGKGNCVVACPTKALDTVGRAVTVQEVFNEVMKEKRYYEGSEGGVTISGGEPALQGEFVLSLAQALKKENVHVALESSGICKYETYEKLLPYIDLFLYDCKETNPELHKKYTNVKNTRIMENLRKLHAAKANILLRCPVIKGLNDRDDHFKALAEISKELPNLVGVEILPYHKLGTSKAERMGLSPQTEYEQIPRGESDKWSEIVRSYGGNVFVS
jgi:pyruvate formate lyase activating enzyme